MTPTETIDAEIKRLNRQLAITRSESLKATRMGVVRLIAGLTTRAAIINLQIDEAHLRKQVIASERNLNGNLR